MALDEFFTKFAPVDAPERSQSAEPGFGSSAPNANAPAMGQLPPGFIDDDDDGDFLAELAQAKATKAARENNANAQDDVPLQSLFADPEDHPGTAGPKDGFFTQHDALHTQLGGRLQRIVQQRSKRLVALVVGLAIPSAIFLIMTAIVLWSWNTGRLDVYRYQIAKFTESSGGLVGLNVNNVTLDGRGFTDMADVVEAIGANHGDAILSIDPRGVRHRLETLPWVESASVERILPSTLKIDLVERRPIAIWQNNGIHRLIDRNGQEILGAAVEPFVDSLPIVTGSNAPEHANDLMQILVGEPELYEQTLAATRVGERRWDITLLGQVIVKLPDNDVQRAWSILAEAQRRGRLLDRDISVVDLRSADRIIVTSSTAMTPNPVAFDQTSSIFGDANTTSSTDI